MRHQPTRWMRPTSSVANTEMHAAMLPKPVFRSLAALIVLATVALPLGCQDEPAVPVLPAVCAPVLDELSPDSGSVEGGTPITLHGYFVTSEDFERDLIIRVGGQEAEVTQVNRSEGCVACDNCIAAYQAEFRDGSSGELSCEDGDQVVGPTNDPGVATCLEWVCDRVCRGQGGWCDHQTGTWYEPAACNEEVVFLSPPADAPGEAEVVVHSSRGSGLGLVFQYVEDDVLP